MGTPVRFPYGVTNVDKTSVFGNAPFLSPDKAVCDFDDFLTYTAGQWTVTNVGTTPTQALADVTGGVLQLTTVASASSSTFLQKLGASFLPVAGKQLWFEARLRLSNVADTLMVMGLQLTDTTPLDATDGIYFIKPVAATPSVNLICRKDATTGSIAQNAVATLANNTFIDLGFYFDGKRYLTPYVNNVAGQKLDLTTTLSAFLPDAQLRISMGVGNGASASQNAQIDYVFVAQER